MTLARNVAESRVQIAKEDAPFDEQADGSRPRARVRLDDRDATRGQATAVAASRTTGA